MLKLAQTQISRNMQRPEFLNEGPADWIDPMAEEAIGFKRKRTPPSLEPELLDKTKNKEAETELLNDKIAPTNGLIQHQSPSKSLKVTPTGLARKANLGCIREHGSSYSRSLIAMPCDSLQNAEKTSNTTNIQLKIDSSTPTARMRLDDICTCNNWKQPTYTSCREEGPDHKIMFTVKVTVAVDGISATILECFSDPKACQIAAQEHAAQSALWYLNQLGYSSKL